MSRYGFVVLIAACVVVALVLAGLSPRVTHSETRGNTLEERVADLERRLASRPAVAVVDLEEVVNNYKKTADLKQRRADFIRRERSKLETVQDTINERKQKQERMPKDSEQWWDEQTKIGPRERELAVRWQQFERKVKRMQMRDLEEVYKDIVSAIGKVAVQKGVNVVFWRHGGIDEETWALARQEGNLMSHRYMIDIRPILYADDTVTDITEDVKKALPAE